jgi:hypothetical protein
MTPSQKKKKKTSWIWWRLICNPRYDRCRGRMIAIQGWAQAKLNILNQSIRSCGCGSSGGVPARQVQGLTSASQKKVGREGKGKGKGRGGEGKREGKGKKEGGWVGT